MSYRFNQQAQINAATSLTLLAYFFLNAEVCFVAKKRIPLKRNMKVTVFREACCSQDDQVGPLEADYAVEPHESFSSLIQRVVQSSFLQFTSSHSRITGEVDGKDVVEIFSVYDEKTGQIEFKVNPNAPVVELLNGKALSFYFRRLSGSAPINVN